MSENTPDTVILATPDAPYVCVGFHQDPARELDLDFCAQRKIPVLRREIGGGAVLCDQNQLFIEWVMQPRNVPLRIEKRFEMFMAPLIATYADLGVTTAFRAPNDLHCGDRKICGTGAGQVGQAELLVGNIIWDFDSDLMTRVLRSSCDAHRSEIRASLEEYMTHIRREGGRRPDPNEVAEIYGRHLARTLRRDVERDTLRDDELVAAAEVERRWASPEWSEERAALRRHGVKIHQDVWVREAVVGADDAAPRLTARVRENRIEKLTITGDTAVNQSVLTGVTLEPNAVAEAVASCGLGDPVTTNHWTRALLSLSDKPRSTP